MEKVFDEPTSFIFSDVKNTDVDIYIQAPNFKIKEEWTHQINSLLSNQHNFLSCKWEELNAVFVDVFYVFYVGSWRNKTKNYKTPSNLFSIHPIPVANLKSN